jgi:hypothetical protein
MDVSLTVFGSVYCWCLGVFGSFFVSWALCIVGFLVCLVVSLCLGLCVLLISWCVLADLLVVNERHTSLVKSLNLVD